MNNATSSSRPLGGRARTTSDPGLVLDMRSIAAADRAAYWQEAVCDQFVPLDVRPHDAAAFSGRIAAHDVGPLHLRTMQASPHTFVRTRELVRRSDDDFYKVGLIRQGSSLLTQDDREVLLQPGELALYDSTRPYAFRMSKHFEITVCMVPKRFFAMRADELSAATASTIDSRRSVGAVIPGFIDQLARHAGEFTPDQSEALASGLAELINGLVVGLPGRHRGEAWTAAIPAPMLARIQGYIVEHLADPELAPTSIAAAHAVSVSYLHRLFAGTDTTLAGWIREQRLMSCWRALGSPRYAHLSVTAVGARYGLVDPSHFSRAFRARFGTTPSGRRTEASRSR